jgi:hypothetical protein
MKNVHSQTPTVPLLILLVMVNVPHVGLDTSSLKAEMTALFLLFLLLCSQTPTVPLIILLMANVPHVGVDTSSLKAEMTALFLFLLMSTANLLAPTTYALNAIPDTTLAPKAIFASQLTYGAKTTMPLEENATYAGPHIA